MPELETVTSPLVLRRRDLRAGDRAHSHTCSSGVSANLGFSVMLSLGCFPLAAPPPWYRWSLSQGHMCGGRDTLLEHLGIRVLLQGTSHCPEGVLAPLPETRHLSGFVQRFWNLEPRTLHFLAQPSPIQLELPPPLSFCHVTFLIRAFYRAGD